MNLYAEIILNSEALEIDRPFTYKIPKEFEEKIQVGQIVKVPFGMGNKTSEGFVLSIKQESEVDISFRVKKISSIITDEPVIDEDDIEVLEEIRDIMNSYNKSKGQPIRASDSVIADILSNPVYMKMFNKYTDPMLHIK